MKKDKVITIRISADTYEKIKKTQQSVSDFVRNAVDQTINVAKNIKNSVQVTTDEVVAEVKENFSSETSKPDFSHIYAYHTATLARDEKCEICSTELRTGEKAVFGLDDRTTKPHIFCLKCKGE